MGRRGDGGGHRHQDSALPSRGGERLAGGEENVKLCGRSVLDRKSASAEAGRGDQGAGNVLETTRPKGVSKEESDGEGDTEGYLGPRSGRAVKDTVRTSDRILSPTEATSVTEQGSHKF